MHTVLRAATLLVVLHAAAIPSVAAYYAPFVTFNNGDITADKTCTDEEMTAVAAAVMKAVTGLRRSRRLGAFGKQSHRELQLIKCHPLMAWATAKCGGAIPTRRLNKDETIGATVDASMPQVENKQESVRELQSNTVCASNTTKFNAALDAVSSKVSAKCRAFIAVRSFECRQVLDCDITTFHTWNAATNKIFKSNYPVPGQDNTFCHGTDFSFQAKTIFDVGRMRVTLTGPDGYSYSRSEHTAPYYLYGDKAGDVFGNLAFNGALLKVGSYTLTAVAANAPDSPYVAQFRIRNCN